LPFLIYSFTIQNVNIKQQILALLALEPEGLRASELRAEIRPKVSQPTLWRRLNELRSTGLIMRIGRGRSCRYVAASAGDAIGELRSRALHLEVGKKLMRKPELLNAARERLKRMRVTAPYAKAYLEHWESLLSGPIEPVLRVFGAYDEEAKALRHVSPFAGALNEKERILVLRRQGLAP
jgi:DNA-binding HxlR family transcriptional regulator